MEIKRGIPVSAGVAIGPALVLDTEFYRIPQRTVDPAQTAKLRYGAAPQVLVPNRGGVEFIRLLGNDRPRTLSIAAGLGERQRLGQVARR